MIIKLLRALGVTSLSLGLIILVGMLYLAKYDSSHCGQYCTAAGIGEGIIIIFTSLPLIIIGLITSVIAYFIDKKNQQDQVQGGKINFSKILFIFAGCVFVFSVVLVPDLYFGIFNFLKDFIEKIFGL